MKKLLRTDSVYTKYLLVMFVVVFVASGIAYGVMFLSTLDQLTKFATDQIQGLVDFLVGMMERFDLTPQEVLPLVQEQADFAAFYTNKAQLPEYFRGLEMEPMRLYFQIESTSSAWVMPMEGGFFYVQAFNQENGQLVQFHWLLMRALLLSAAIASICLVVVLRRAVRPIKKLDAAIQEVARGNFDVSVDHKSRDEMGHVVRNFNWMVRELRNIEYLRKDFVSSVSHEFKTPIAAIRGGVKLLTSTPFSQLSREKFQKYTGLIYKEANRMDSLSSNLLRLSSLENQSAMQKTTRFSLDEQIRQTILLMENQWSAKGISLDIQLDRVELQGDQELIQQVWINLLSNAIKFTGPEGNISIKLREQGQYAMVEIADDGIGMTQETQRRIFEKFYQEDRSRSREGNGLGMSIVKRILDLHRGTIAYQSAPGEGTICRVRLPLREESIQTGEGLS